MKFHGAKYVHFYTAGFPDLPECSGDRPTFAPPEERTRGLRLPSSLIPQHYNLEIKPDLYAEHPDNFTFSGVETIYLYVNESTNKIVVQYRDISIDKDTVLVHSDEGVPYQITALDEDESREFFNITLSHDLLVGNIILVTMGFSDKLENDLFGLYWSAYREDNETKYVSLY